jgi:hypothetical protein
MNSSESDQSSQTGPAELTRASLIMRLTAIGVVIAGIAGLFCVCGRLVDATQTLTGIDDR